MGGFCTLDGPFYVIVEFAEHGNLWDFLRKHADRNDGYERPNTVRPLISEKQLISFARQASPSNYKPGLIFKLNNCVICLSQSVVNCVRGLILARLRVI